MREEKKARRPLTYDDRLAIERGLNRGDTISWIARTIGRAPKVVREEVRRNWTADPSGHLVVQNSSRILRPSRASRPTPATTSMAVPRLLASWRRPLRCR